MELPHPIARVRSIPWNVGARELYDQRASEARTYWEANFEAVSNRAIWSATWWGYRGDWGINVVGNKREELARRNYVLHAAPKTKYWCQYHYAKLRGLEKKFGDKFCLITYGAAEVEQDYYVIPFAKVKSAFSDETLAKSHLKRWITRIEDGILHVSNHTEAFDIRGYHGNFALLEEAMQRR